MNRKVAILIIVLIAISFFIGIGYTKSKEEIINNIPELLTKLKTTKGEMRWHIIYDLGYSGDPRAVDPLIIIVNDNDEKMWYRRIAAYALGLNGNIKAIPCLKNNLNSEDEELKMNSAGALVLLGEKEIAYPIIEELIDKGNPKALDYLVIREEGTVVGVRDLKAKDILIKSLNNANDRVKVNSAFILIKSKTLEKNSKVFYDLTENILDNSKDPGAIEGAISILKNIGDKKAEKVLQNSLSKNTDEDTKTKINNAIRNIQKKQN